MNWRGALLLCFVSVGAAAQPPEQATVDVPAIANAFIEAGTRPIAFETADLNGDGLPDHVLVLEKSATPEDSELQQGQRLLLVLIGQSNGTLKLAARNDKVVYCSGCGGMMGDPFQGVTTSPKRFTVSHYGGSGWRWSNAYKFAYSRRDQTWQLVEVSETRFHASEPEKEITTISKPPKAFGKINLADFDPQHWQRAGAR